MPPDGRSEPAPARCLFPTTRWTVIRTVKEGTEEQIRAALETFCATYWSPVYAYCRHSGFSIEAAEDLTQMYFEQLIRYETLRKADPDRGLLRFFVLSTLKRLIAKHLRHQNAQKRGAGERPLSLARAEEAYLREAASLTDASKLFDRAWARRIVDTAEERLRGEFEEAGALRHFEVLKEFLPHHPSLISHQNAAGRLGLSDGAFRLHLHRLRKRFVLHVEEEISLTVTDPNSVQEEMSYLVDLLTV